ncbi:FeoA family protein [Calorimonas adulescens]|uniref:Ferrous iron transport protein A n=1 Tax=Calorimonas adulescens TaxID=2606906 RepID=A0A5D8QG08_9THEO|nr:ferrous iron transport protein A [Calorimonas adulescens]TZE83485.1 ferrous iron transport protein A [Calorimonas adulescens]
MILANAKVGQTVEIVDIMDSDAKIKTLRLGIGEGSKIKCVEKISNGPVVIRSRMQELAVGKKLAEKIVIKPVE